MDQRPKACRFRLQDEGKVYPRSSCTACGKGVLSGLGKVCSIVAEADSTRIAELEAAIRLITYRSDCGSEVGVYPAQREHVNLMNIAPVLATVWPDN